MTTAHDFSFTTLAEGKPLPLSLFAGKALLVVNVASACGYTPQYTALQALYEAHAAQGLVVLGVPCNDFGAQESGSEEAIAAFCDTRFHVGFPMTGKVAITAPAARHPFYQWIAAEVGEGALPRWNFHKFLIGRDGALREGFASAASPTGPEITAAVLSALSE